MTDCFNASPCLVSTDTKAKLALAQCREAARLAAGFPLFDQLVGEFVFNLSFLNNAPAAERLATLVNLRNCARLALRQVVTPEPEGLSDLEIEGFVGGAMAAALDTLSVMPATIGREC